MPLPSWLQISPSDYLRAVEAGTRAGLSIRQANEAAFEHGQRMQMAQEAQQQHEKQLAIENAVQRLAQERLEEYRQGELKNQQARLGIEQQGLALRGETASQAEEARRLGLDLRERSLKDTEERNKSAEQRAQDKLDIERRLADLNEQLKQGQLDRKPKPRFVNTPKGLMQVDEDTGELSPPKFAMPPKPPESHATVDALVGAGAGMLGRANVFGMHPFGFLQSPTASTNAPAGAIPATPTAAPAPKKRVKVKGPTGQTGTIEEGDVLPDGWTPADSGEQ